MRFRAARTMMTLAWQADRTRTVLAFVVFTAHAGFAALFAFWLKLLLDSVADRDTRASVIIAVTLASSIVAEIVLGYVGSRIQHTLNDRAHHLVEKQLLELVGNTPTLEIHETPEHLTQLELLEYEAFEFGNVIPSLLEMMTTLIRMASIVILLASVHPLLLFLPAFGIPMLVLSRRTSALYNRGNELSAEPRRRADDLRELLTTSGSAKEIRLFRLADEILARFHHAMNDVRMIHVRLQIRGQLIGLGTRIIFLVGYFGAIVFVTFLVLDRTLSIGDVVMTAVLAGQMLAMMSGSAEKAHWAMRCLTAAGRYVYLQDVAHRSRSATRSGVVLPDRLSDGIRLEQVSYSYANGITALHNVDLVLPAGATVAVVGENGAGKTTLIKLLAGLYKPTNGRIVIDGVHLADLDLDEWRSRISAGFQDYARLEFQVRDTVGVGDLARKGDTSPGDVPVREAITRAGADDLMNALPAGLSTQLGPSWPAGIDLSGGQWQKLAIARALMRTAPLLLLLDEPTSALDADTEHRLFERWAENARAARKATGAVTVLVSHRFSTVRMADLIVVVDKGKITEVGTHLELVRRGGLYAELFELQASAYR